MRTVQSDSNTVCLGRNETVYFLASRPTSIPSTPITIITCTYLRYKDAHLPPRFTSSHCYQHRRQSHSPTFLQALPSYKPYLPKRLIALEEHVVSPSLEAEVIASGLIQRSAPGTLEKLKNVGTGRIADMDAGRLSLMVLAQQSASGMEDPDGCSKANNAVQDAIKSNPKRFAGFAVLPLATPDQGAAELERRVKKLGFRGAMIWNHLKDGTYFDGGRFDPVFAKAQELDVPLSLHPDSPTQDIFQRLFAGDYVQPQTAGRFITNSWGWHVDVGTHILRRYGAGVFDRFPKLKVMIGHNGEDLPMFIDRVNSTALRNDTTFDRVWNTNIWTTTSAFFTVRAFQQLRQVAPIERIMYSVDYPFSNITAGWQFVQQLAEQRVLTNQEMNLFAYKNAEKLLKL
ncbi:Putative 2-amino-3-carboxymuconate-6-semialdehyde decarboxylase, metal-dependent hydrolase [Septoria linicola]|uniref:2-amino-3-carboxymuconate-6-semialdehyde decarboxylase, metal-dependent hydrolase n=1 Tax=Septoria linicola TaxID=215465 RepID=A0A9Q9ATP7_9PEZI|nr:putative 2-amino-3-carboxymuconate-6-semialdehyde decarboxylase, metal-dependent hydrolase [Septoria linicola]USW54549.1 Putative 2-amino-3-carboxymuconate-6-semialdehyde decarboxylase, metal-dependent hydrolase [Septoria linicola]